MSQTPFQQPDSPGNRSMRGSAADMDVELIIAPEAEQDFADAYAWYEDRRIGLGEEFLSCVDPLIGSTCQSRGK